MSLATSNRDGGKTSESGHLRALYKAFGSGVLTGLSVSQRAAGANMSVDVAIGDAIIGRSDGTYGHPAWNDAALNKTVTTADPSNPRRDIVVMYIDYGQAPSTAVSNNTNGVVKIAVVAGTPAGSPADPSDAAIQSAVTSGNPWIKLARVRVGAAATSLSNSVIDDLRAFINPRLNADAVDNMFDHIASGCVWTADSPGSTRVASMTAGVVYIAGKRLTVAAVTSRTFTASKDVYVGFIDAGDGTATPVYYDNTTNAASPALATAGYTILNAIVVVGASSIANAAAINQGQEDKLLPIASSVPYAVTDSLGNLICPRDPQRKILGYRQILSSFSTSSTSVVQVTGLTVPVIVPTGRKVKIQIVSPSTYTNTSSTNAVTDIWDGTVGSGTMLQENITSMSAVNQQTPGTTEAISTPSSSSKTYNAGFYVVGASTGNFIASSNRPAFILVELA